MRNMAGKLVLALILVLNAIALSVFAKNEDEIKALGIFPESVAEAGDDGEILREEFAYMAAKFLQNGELRPSGTDFTDVTADNIYSGYIKFLAGANIIKGNGNGEFRPENPVKLSEAYKILIDTLGFSNLADLGGSWEENYLTAANYLGISKGVAANENGMLTKRAAVKLISNVLFTELPNERIYVSEDRQGVNYITDGNRTVLAERFGVSAYEGSVGSVDISENTAVFTVSENAYDTNPKMLSAGEIIPLKPENGISLYDYEHMPVTVWMSDSDELVYIGFSGDVEVKYGYILSVNGDSDEDARYSPDYINRITIQNEKTEYKLADSCRIMMNRSFVTSPVALTQRFAKIVLINGRVSYIEAWELVEGGIITASRGGEIQYTTGERINASIDNYDKCTDRLFFIGGRRADEAEIKANSLFFYFVKDDFSILVASEKIISDELVGASYKGINIGGISYETNGSVYYSEDGIRYKLNEGVEKLYKLPVSAYVAPNGKILYVRSDRGAVKSNEFIGVVYGVGEADAFSNDRKIVLWSLAGENPEKVTYTLTSKTVYEDALTIGSLIQNSKKYDGSGVFKFTVNGKGVITKVSELDPFCGFGTGRVTVTTTYLHGANRAYLQLGNQKLFFDQSKITVIYNNNGEFSVKQITWADLRERTFTNGVTFEFFGEEMESIPSLVLLTGDVETIGSTAGSYLSFVLNRFKTVDADGNTVYVLEASGSNGKVEYTVSEQVANRIPEHAMILFTPDLKFSNDGIYLRGVADLTGNISGWTMNDCTVVNSYLSSGVLKKYDGIRIYLEDGTAFFTNGNPSIVCYDPSARDPFIFGKNQYDVKPGDLVAYMVYDGIVISIVYQRN